MRQKTEIKSVKCEIKEQSYIAIIMIIRHTAKKGKENQRLNEEEKKKKKKFLILSRFLSLLKGVQLSFEQQNGSRLTTITLIICVSVLLTMGAFALLYFVKRNDRIRNKLAEITHVKGLSNNYYQVSETGKNGKIPIQLLSINKNKCIYLTFTGSLSTTNASSTDSN